MTTTPDTLDAVLGPAPAQAVRLTGEDRRSYLHAVTTQHLTARNAGEAVGALILDAHGQLLAELLVLAGEDADLLVVPDAAVEHVLGVTARRTFLAQATFTPIEDRVAALRGSAVEAALSAAGIALEPGRWSLVDGCAVARHAGGAELVGPEEAQAAVAERLVAAGVTRVDADGLEDARIRAGVPRFGTELVAPHLPEEAGVLASHVHMSKGCYPGQEAVARMWMLGRPRRALALVRAPRPLAAGEERGSGSDRVVATSVATGGHDALAYVRPDVAVGQRLADDVEVLALVGAGAEPPGWTPAQTRGRDRQGQRAR